MCTASWLIQPQGYELFFNRDERRSRARGLPPRQAALRGVRYLSPIDLACGGSWIAANELGVTLCLLNRYPDPHPDGRPTTSRGLIVLGMADAKGADDVALRLRDANLLAYRPFTLVVVEPQAGATAFAFDGRELARQRPAAEPFLTSSSQDDAAAGDSRQALWRRLRAETAGADLHRRFHASHWPDASALSVCMHRADAETESHSWVRVGGERVEMIFAAGPPCAAAGPMRLELARRSDAAA